MVETNDINELKALIVTLLSRISDLENRVVELETENADLRRQLTLTSANSHKPPSSDGYTKKTALPKPPGGKVGAQPGHPGKTLEMVSTPDLLIIHQATHCPDCGQLLNGPGALLSRRQVFDLPTPRLHVVEHQLYQHQCPCGAVVGGEFPPTLTAPVQYGPRIRGLSSLLNTDYRLPFAKISQLWADLVGYAVNESTLTNANATLYQELMPIESIIKAQLPQAPVAHFDETGLRVVGKLHWLHVACTDLYTYLFVHPNRGQQALLSAQSVFEQCHHWTVHDCWASYFTAGKGRHCLCGAHLLRELQALIDQGSQWAPAMHGYLLEAYQVSRDGPIASQDQDQWRDRYAALCQQGDAEELPALVFFRADGRQSRAKRSKGRNLLERLISHQVGVLAFAFEAGVPFTNNQAERDLRPAKVKLKVSNCFRTESGAAHYARIAGFVSTMRKNKLNVLEQLTNVLSGSFQWAT